MIHSAVPLWVRRGVCAGDRPVQVQRLEQVPQRGDLVGLIGHPPLPHDHAAGLVQGRQQMRGPLPGPPGSAHGLAVHGDHPPAADGAHACAQPGRHPRVEVVGVHPLEHPPDRGLTGQGPPLLQVQVPQVGRFQVGDVLAHRPQRTAPRQDPHHRQAQDRGQGVAHPAPVPGVGHPLQNLLQGLARQGGRGR